jgi:hypothetical protein
MIIKTLLLFERQKISSSNAITETKAPVAAAIIMGVKAAILTSTSNTDSKPQQ